MDHKIEVVIAELHGAFPDAELEYRFAEELHKFRLNFATHTHWLIIDSATMEDSDVVHLRNLLEIYQVIRVLKESEFSRRILLTRQGIKDQPIPK